MRGTGIINAGTIYFHARHVDFSVRDAGVRRLLSVREAGAAPFDTIAGLRKEGLGGGMQKTPAWAGVRVLKGALVPT